MRLFAALAIIVCLSFSVVAQDSLNVSLVATMDATWYYSDDVAYCDNHAYVTCRDFGIRIIDVSVPAYPLLVASCLEDRNGIKGVAVEDGYAYVVDENVGVHVLNVSDPSQPQIVGFYAYDHVSTKIVISNGYAYVLCGGFGLRILDISDPTTPVELGWCITADSYLDIAVDGHYAYIAADNAGMQVLDVSDPTSPVEVGSITGEIRANGLDVFGNHAYIADQWDGVYIVDISNPTTPELTSRFPFREHRTLDVTYAFGHAFVAMHGDGVLVLDVRNPATPVQVTDFVPTGEAQAIAVDLSSNYFNGYVYVTNHANGLSVLDVTPPSGTAEVGRYAWLGGFSDVKLANGYAFVGIYTNGLRVMDISDPYAPVEAAFLSIPTGAHGIWLVDDYVYVAAGMDGFVVVDVSNPIRPVRVSGCAVPDKSHDIAVSPGYAYVVSRYEGLHIIDTSDPLNPFVVGNCTIPDVSDAVTYNDGYVYVSAREAGVRIIDVSNPASPVEVASFPSTDEVLDVEIVDNIAYVACYHDGVLVLDISDPANPVEISTYFPDQETFNLTSRDGYLFLANGNRGLIVMDISNPFGLGELGYYETPGYAGDLDVADGFAYIGDGQHFTILDYSEAISGVSPVWPEFTVNDNFLQAFSVYAADMDGDGDNDVLGAASVDDDIAWWENLDGSGVSWTEHTVDGNFNDALSVFAMDVDGDGDMDVLGASGLENDITWWENLDGNGVNWNEHPVDGEFGGAHSVYAVDVDGDGDTDVLGAAGEDNDITWWENADGGGLTWIEHAVAAEFSGALSVFASDVDSDGDTDILGAGMWADDITWWENMDGTGLSWDEHTVAGEFDGANSVYATDVDGDGDVDVLGGARFESDVNWWENVDGDGLVWVEHSVDADFIGAYSIYATDVDGDGDTDVLGAAKDIDEIAWWENLDGGGLMWRELLLSDTFDGAASVYAADMDGDGDNDVLGAAAYASDITWWKQPGAPFPVTLTLTPTSNLELPAEGGTLVYDLYLVNGSALTWPDSEFTTYVTLPDNTLYGPLFTYPFDLIPFMDLTYTNLTQSVPDYAPEGSYSFVARVGYPTQYIEDSFEFSKLGAVSGRMNLDDWSATGWIAEDVASPTSSELPERFVMNTAYPNPFNSTTMISVALPESVSLTVTVFNITGQLVAELANGQFTAGQHSLTFDASGLASGLYFVRATVPGQLNATQKVMLVR
jgi:hypothetical protein